MYTPESYEPEAVAAVKRWFDETGRGSSVYTCGPSLPSASQATANDNESKMSKESAEIQAFLDETLSQSGENSLLYVSAIRPTFRAHCSFNDLMTFGVNSSRLAQCSGP